MNQVQAAAAADEALKEASIRTLRSTPTTCPRWTITAWPYLKAIKNNDYGYEDPVMCVLYALNNMTGWKGDVARRVKAELSAAIKDGLK